MTICVTKVSIATGQPVGTACDLGDPFGHDGHGEELV